MHLQVPTWLLDIKITGNQALILLGMVAAIVILSFLINTILVNSIGGIYRVFVAPGVIIHELSHALGCMLTGAKITSIQVFKKDGGEVRHTPPKVPIIGQIIISLAPFFIGFLAIYYIAKVVGVKTIPLDIGSALFAQPLQILWEMLRSIEFGSLITWLAFYLILTIAVTMTPSSQDLRNVILSVITVIAIIFVLVRYLNLHINYSWLFRPELLAILGSSIIILIGSLFLSIIIAVLAGLFKAR